MARDEHDDSGPEASPDHAVGETAAERDLDMEIPEEVLALQPVYEAIAHPRRRYLVYTLSEDTEWTLDELATKLAAWVTDTPEAEIATLTHDEMYVSLYHAHVPKLVELDVIEFDADTETITPGENAAQVLAVLEGAGGSLDSRQETHARHEFDSDDIDNH
ncbi:DUF7344 domain-containing protein [Halomicrococcus sp. NG-SE-24]|uniref:DUF7344 domain-containing protein n=1 Tax=Halomicrococcus sp. NG-SE-24 TaxID=3436928 RepID=UPI003D98CD6D